MLEINVRNQAVWPRLETGSRCTSIFRCHSCENYKNTIKYFHVIFHRSGRTIIIKETSRCATTPGHCCVRLWKIVRLNIDNPWNIFSARGGRQLHKRQYWCGCFLGCLLSLSNVSRIVKHKTLACLKTFYNKGKVTMSSNTVMEGYKNLAWLRLLECSNNVVVNHRHWRVLVWNLLIKGCIWYGPAFRWFLNFKHSIQMLFLSENKLDSVSLKDLKL